MTSPIVFDKERTYADEVQDSELRRYNDNTAAVRIKPPRLRDAEEFLQGATDDARKERQTLKRYGRPLQVPDSRGVRGEQFAEAPSVDTQIALLRQGRQSLLSPYYNEATALQEGVLLTTSWVDNVRFDVTLVSNGPTIYFDNAPASRHVSAADEFIESTFDNNGMPNNGGEYAVFACPLSATQRIRSAPKQTIAVDVQASYTSNNTRVVKTLRAAQLSLVLNMAEIHPILMTNADNGKPITTASGAVVRKSGEQLPFAPTASVFKRPARYTFRYRPSERHWMLTRVDFALRRTQLQGVPDSQSMLYFDPRWKVAGEPLSQRLLTVIQTEDPGSNPLDPSVYLEVFPLRRDTSLSGLPLIAGQSHEIELAVTTKLVPRKVIDQTGKARRTLYTKLPSLDIKIPDAAALLRAAPRRGIETYRVSIVRPEKQKRIDFTSSENSLHNAPVAVLVAPSVEEESAYEIVALQIGPIVQSALYEAIDDSLSRI